MAVETTEYLKAAERFIRAAGRRCAESDPEDFGQLLELSELLRQAQQTAVDGMLANGFSWAEIARGANMKRQSAHQRWGGR